MWSRTGEGQAADEQGFNETLDLPFSPEYHQALWGPAGVFGAQLGCVKAC